MGLGERPRDLVGDLDDESVVRDERCPDCLGNGDGGSVVCGEPAGGAVGDADEVAFGQLEAEVIERSGEIRKRPLVPAPATAGEVDDFRAAGAEARTRSAGQLRRTCAALERHPRCALPELNHLITTEASSTASLTGHRARPESRPPNPREVRLRRARRAWQARLAARVVPGPSARAASRSASSAR